ncbi:MAG: hypothetical protein LBU89_14810 [Fibromonadaceae bacterium]|nr:hypothetical protein [Fibromonadaceae bacterium]
MNNKIQEAAYILALGGDTAKAEQLLGSALLPSALASEKLKAHLYLAKIAEAKGDSSKAIEHYNFLKNNSQNVQLVYMVANKKKVLGAREEKIKIASIKEPEKINIEEPEIKKEARFANCGVEGELYLAQRTVYNCPDNSLHLVSKRNEVISIPFVGQPAKVFLILDGIFLYSENSLYFHSLNNGLKPYIWRRTTLEVQDIKEIGDKIYVLDISGNISLLKKNSGELVSKAKSDGEKFFNPGVGLIGTYQKNGGISVLDTLLNNLWDYQIDGKIDTAITKADSVFFYLQNGSSEVLYTRHYQKLTAPSNTDSLLEFESGNAFAWYNIAVQKNSDSAWQRAVIYGARKGELSSFIFTEYAKRIGARWVKYLPVSSNTLYPNMFNDASWLFVYDYGAQNLLKLSLETGSINGEILLPRTRKYTLKHTLSSSPWLVLNSGYWLSLFSLKEQRTVSFEMPGLPFDFLRSRDSIYVGLENGFVLKYSTPRMRLEGARKVSSAQVFLSRGEKGVYSLSQRKISLLSSDMLVNKEFNLALNGVANDFKSKNGLFAVVLEEGRVQFFSEAEDFKQIGSFSVPSSVASIELLEKDGKIYALVGEANQVLSLYEPSGVRVWTFRSNGSAAMQPILHNSHIWLDQDGSVVAIDVNSGKVVKKYDIFGSGASISIYNNTLYCFTPEKLLYAFPL